MLNDNGISWKGRFTNTMYLNNKIWPNDVFINVHMLPVTAKGASQHITFQKVKYMFSRILQNSLFINSDENIFNVFDTFDNDVIDFFETPVDQIVGVTLLAKLDAIGGDNMKVDALEIESWQGENLNFMITPDSPEWALLQKVKTKNPWWHDQGPRISNFTKNKLTWEEIGFTIDNNDKFRVIQGGEQ